MRILTLTAILCLVPLLVPGSAAAEAAPRGGGDPALVPDDAPVSLPSAVHLTLSPLFLEILAIEDQSRETEQFLLGELAKTTDTAEATRIVRSLERLDTDRRLRILKARMDYARRSGHFDLALRLRREITDLMTKDLQATR